MNKAKILKKLFWDKNIDIAYLVQLLDGESEQNPGDRIELYRKLLTSCDWYTLLKIIPADQLKKEALNERVIRQLFPKELKARYRYAKDILIRTIVMPACIRSQNFNNDEFPLEPNKLKERYEPNEPY